MSFFGINIFGWGSPNSASPNSSLNNPSDSTQQIYKWFLENQRNGGTPLVTSYPGEPGLRDQGFTYDQALAGIVFLSHGDLVAAKKIFNFYTPRWDGAGFWTVYNSLSQDGSQLEYMKVMGPTAWLGIFFLHYYSKTKDAKALDLALKIAGWVKTLPHKDGGVAMGVDTPWKNVYSVENNLDYYALLKGLIVETGAADKQWLKAEFDGLRDWFKIKAYDPASGLFRRAPVDITHAMDTNAWSILTFGVEDISAIFNINIHDLVERVEKNFVVQPSGEFGGDALLAKGFDFSNSHNALSAGRKGIKWIEGTNQMICAYKALSDHYSGPESGDTSRATHYGGRVSYFLKRNEENKIIQNGQEGYVYTDAPGAKIWWDNPYWKASSGASVASTSWVYFSIKNVNPFIPTPVE